jgi:hypothetical protein
MRGAFLLDPSKAPADSPESDVKLPQPTRGQIWKVCVQTAVKLSVFIVICLAGNFTWACSVEEVLSELQDKVTGTLSAEQLSNARKILQVHCQTEVDEAVNEAVAMTEATAKTELAAEEESPPTLFGIEFRKADENSKGHDRLNKRP